MQDTWRETFHTITSGTADTTLAGAGRAVFAIVGTKTVRLTAARISGRGNPGSTTGRPGSPRPLLDMVEWQGQPADRSRDDCA